MMYEWSLLAAVEDPDTGEMTEVTPQSRVQLCKSATRERLPTIRCKRTWDEAIGSEIRQKLEREGLILQNNT